MNSSRATAYSNIFPSGALNSIAIGSVQFVNNLLSSSAEISRLSILLTELLGAFATSAELAPDKTLTLSFIALISSKSNNLFKSSEAIPFQAKSVIVASIAISLRR